LGQSFGELGRRLEAKGFDAVEEVLTARSAKDPGLAGAMGLYYEGDIAKEDLVSYLELRALGEGGAPPAKTEDPAGAVRRIKSQPGYGDPGVQSQSNWLGRALERLRNIRWPQLQPPRGAIAPGGFGSALIPIVWTLLGAGVLVFLYYALRHVRARLQGRRRAKAVLEEDEPERTLDEWLAQADELAAQGRHREAVRALYLACLLRFDEHRVARFIRGETNWEHLRRIEGSGKLPDAIDFRTPTQAFDRIWYGRKVRGMEDVTQFRDWYSAITVRLAEATS
jgi:hypothetical protein